MIKLNKQYINGEKIILMNIEFLLVEKQNYFMIRIKKQLGLRKEDIIYIKLNAKDYEIYYYKNTIFIIYLGKIEKYICRKKMV
jgi:hypothetical protein